MTQRPAKTQPHGRTADFDYRGRLYASYLSSHHDAADSDRADATFTRDIVGRLPDDRTVRILDVGCGTGRLVRLIRASGYANVQGIDTSAEQVAQATRKGIPKVQHSDLFDFLAGHSNHFDVVIATDLLEHLEKPTVLHALDIFAQSLKPGGLLIARTPNGESPFAGRYHYGDFTHGTIFTFRSLHQVLTATGFTQVRPFPVNPAVHGLLSALRWLTWQLIAAGLKVTLMAEAGPARNLIVTQNLVVTARRSDVPGAGAPRPATR